MSFLLFWDYSKSQVHFRLITWGNFHMGSHFNRSSIFSVLFHLSTNLSKPNDEAQHHKLSSYCWRHSHNGWRKMLDPQYSSKSPIITTWKVRQPNYSLEYIVIRYDITQPRDTGQVYDIVLYLITIPLKYKQNPIWETVYSLGKKSPYKWKLFLSEIAD